MCWGVGEVGRVHDDLGRPEICSVKMFDLFRIFLEVRPFYGRYFVRIR